MQPSKHVLPLLMLASEALLKEQRCSETCSDPEAGSSIYHWRAVLQQLGTAGMEAE